MVPILCWEDSRIWCVCIYIYRGKGREREREAQFFMVYVVLGLLCEDTQSFSELVSAGCTTPQGLKVVHNFAPAVSRKSEACTLHNARLPWLRTCHPWGSQWRKVDPTYPTVGPIIALWAQSRRYVCYSWSPRVCY